MRFVASFIKPGLFGIIFLIFRARGFEDVRKSCVDGEFNEQFSSKAKKRRE